MDPLRRKCLRRPPWSLSEEITFVHQHAVLGNAWARLAAHLPQRDSSEVKNIFYSTTRSKGGNNRRVLSTYARAVQGREDQPESRVAALAAALAEVPACVATAQAARVDGWEEAAQAAEDAARQLRQLQQAATGLGSAANQQASYSPVVVAAAAAQAVPAQLPVRDGSSGQQPYQPRKQSPEPLAGAAAVQTPAAAADFPQRKQPSPQPMPALYLDASPNRGLHVPLLRLGRDNNSHIARTAAGGLAEPAYDEGPNSNDSSIANNLSLSAVPSSLGVPTMPARRVQADMSSLVYTDSGGGNGSTQVAVPSSGSADGVADSTADHGLLLLLAAAEGAAGAAAGPTQGFIAPAVGRRPVEAAAAQAALPSIGSGGSDSADRIARRLQELEEGVFGAMGSDLAWGSAAAPAAESRRAREWDELTAAKRQRVASCDGANAPVFPAAGAGEIDGSSIRCSEVTAADVSAIAARLRQLTAGDGLAAAHLLLQQLLQPQTGAAAATGGGGYSNGRGEAGQMLGSGVYGVASSWTQQQPPQPQQPPLHVRPLDGRGGNDWRVSLHGYGGAGTGPQGASPAPMSEPLLSLRWCSRTAANNGASGGGSSAAVAAVGGHGGVAAAAGALQPPAAAAAATERLGGRSLYAAERQQVTQAAAAAAAAAVLARYGRASAPAYACKQ
ncbi:hypothetical protein CHLRE_12g507500v5 [Chlamydomonas reinhardtii]|uniref:Myb-like domain-containing protein n=1 Tax=Chlamydomonas reinhardtii TaxID=3055 RepID=A0A2K3D2T8_CHLRE|nr:uncharacterized protein CHLRE_12g507500v5 [Chlamydomonas reinhardtii]PNW74851.1 hypothetical protein CHLRE_12g507500v5 [Chlamydomonas reinhardtii]